MVIGGQGLGDCILSLQCASVIQNYGIIPKIVISARPEIQKALSFLFDSQFKLDFIDDYYSKYDRMLREKKLMDEVIQGFGEIYYIVPHLIYCNNFRFNFEKYNTSPQVIREIKLLTKNRKIKKIIYAGLLSVKLCHMFKNSVELVIKLATAMQDYEIYFPIIQSWAGKEIPAFSFPEDIPSNLHIDVNPELKDALAVLLGSCYFVGLDNGPSHIAYQAGIPRLILDSRMTNLGLIIRWRENLLESVPISSSTDSIVYLIKTNLEIPQTTLLPRDLCLLNKGLDWVKALSLRPL